VRIAILTTIWKRRALASCAMRFAARNAESVAEGTGDTFILVAVGSEGEESRRVAEDAGWVYVEHPNQPLGAKLNAGFAACRDFGADAVIAFGSDDFASPGLLAEWSARLAEGATICGVIDMFKVHAKTREAIRWPGYRGARKGESIGPWRAISGDVLAALDWAPYDPTLSKNLDNSMTKRLDAAMPDWRERSHVVTMADAASAVLDVSTPGRITPWELAAWGSEPAVWPDVASWMTEDERSEILAAAGAPSAPAKFAPCASPRLSAAIIVRDMLDTFPATLASLVGVVDEVVVVVDAASVPETATIAREAGCRVHIQPWRGYGPQRTDSIRLCRAPWVLVIDADEEIVSGDDIRDTLATAPEGVDGLAVRMEIGAYGSGEVIRSHSIRVVRREKAWYEHAEHNELRGVTSVGRCGITIRTSYADRSPESVSEKLSRLMELAAKEPTVQHHAYHVAKTLRALGSLEASGQWAARCIELDETSMYGAAAYYELAYAAGATGGMAIQDEVLLRATKLHPDYADLWALWSSTTLLRACQAATTDTRYAMLAQAFGVEEAVKAPAVGEMLRFPVRVEMVPPRPS